MDRKVWKGLTVIVCCHWDRVYGEQRREYLYLLLDSLAINKRLPEQVIVSFTTASLPPPQIKKYPFPVKTIYRGENSISQISQLLMTIYEEKELRYILLLDDDDLTSPNLIDRHHKVWRELKKPALFYFQCGLTRGTEGSWNLPISNATKFDEEWKLSRPFGRCECEYGGTCCSLEVLIYYLKCILACAPKKDNSPFEKSKCDVELFEMGSVDTRHTRHNYIQEDLMTYNNIPGDDSVKIHKYRIEEPLYYHRKWRDEGEVYEGTDEEISEIIRGIKKKQFF